MKKIKSKHLWRRGATLLLAMLMLFTCVGSALPRLRRRRRGTPQPWTAATLCWQTVLLAGTAPATQTPTCRMTPRNGRRCPAGKTSARRHRPLTKATEKQCRLRIVIRPRNRRRRIAGDSIPDESESEPTEQPGEGDADLPEDEQPGGEEPDPDEDEEIPEDEPEDVPFEALVILDPENGATVQAEVGEEVTFKAPVNREDVAVAYQWQRFQKPAQGQRTYRGTVRLR